MRARHPLGWRLVALAFWLLPLRRLACLWVLSRERYYQREGKPLSSAEKGRFAGFFHPEVLDHVRIQTVDRVGEPWFLRWFLSGFARLGFTLDLRLSQAAGLTLGQTVLIAKVAGGRRSDPGLLFHELVHVVQYRLLGVEGFIDEYVSGWLATGCCYREIPLEIQAYQLEGRFRKNPSEVFSVQTELLGQLLRDPHSKASSSD